MNIYEARRIAQEVMTEHGLIADGWTFKWDNAVKRFGQCDYRNRTISLSKPLTQINPHSEVLDTLLHEIAHALAGHKAGHGSQWRAVARRIGCDAKRTHSAAIPELRYYMECPMCHHKSPRARKTKTRKACGKCCRKYSGGKFDSRFEMFWVDNPAFVG